MCKQKKKFFRIQNQKGDDNDEIIDKK